ncbi:MAG: heat shock protein HspQ [Gammaproteobacteria bacterium]|nr:heat shock protein HspQ [Gammaproteobacteria bacterium]
MIQFKQYETPRPEPFHRFAVGALIRHRRYDYRGVIVAADARCQASEAWWSKNKTRPDRDQPWYHVLVHGTATNTYAAESSLTEEWLPDEVEHPLVAFYFESFAESYYKRNERPWCV